jgi:hypothetical protein
MAACVVGLGASIAILAFRPHPVFAYAGMSFLALATVLYLLPGKPPEGSLVFSRDHPFFGFLRMANMASVPLTVAFVWAGLEAATRSWYWALLLLTLARMVPEVVLARITRRRRRDLLCNTPQARSLSEVREGPMCGATGHIFETRMRQRRLGRTLYNVWLVDDSLQKVFLPAMTHVKGITEPFREGARVYVAGPSALAPGIASIQPVASVVLPGAGASEKARWYDVVWKRSLARRMATTASGSVVYLLAMIVLAWGMSDIAGQPGRSLALGSVSLLSGLFFAFLSRKAGSESAHYDIRGYFEPRWRGLESAARDRRLQRLRQNAEEGRIPREYLGLVEGAPPERL